MKVAMLTTDSREYFGDYDNPTPYFGTAPEALLQGLAQMPGLEVHVISCVQRPLRSPEKIADNIFYHAEHVSKLGWLRTGYQGCIRAVRRRLRMIQPAIVHGQGTERDCAISAVFSGFPNVLTIHGNMAAMETLHRKKKGAFFYWCAARLETLALRRTAGVFCNSAYTEAFVAPRTQKTWRVPNALRLPFFAPVVDRSPAPPPIILNIGVISPRKRQVEILELAHGLHRQGARFCLHFVGPMIRSDPYGLQFADRLPQAEAAGYARYRGSLEGDELMSCFDSADALLHLPSEEAFGLVVAEALARNLKLFATRVGGITEICAGVPDAELFEDGRWSEVAAAIGRWLRAEAPRPENAAAEMAARYHPKVVAERHEQIYREVLSSRA